MYKWVQGVRTYARIRLDGAAPELVLNRLNHEKIRFWEITRVDDFHTDISVLKKDLPRVQLSAEHAQCQAEVLEICGFLVWLQQFRKRKAFVAAVLLILVMAYVLPQYIWFLRVEGNETVPSDQILQELEELGVGFGTKGKNIVPQDLKNKMLNRIPQLEWLTVNTSGAIATVVVREREPAPKQVDQKTVTNLVASQDCMITDMEILSGQAVCEVGQIVQKGELLVSGYADLEFCIQAVPSLGEVYGQTWREQNAVLPAEYQAKGEPEETDRSFSLLIGRKRINLFGNSGIYTSGCDKMTVYHWFTLPGGYTLPLALVEETCVTRTVTAQEFTEDDAASCLTASTTDAVRGDMVAGEILEQHTRVTREGNVYQLTGYYTCREMVARSVPAILWESEGNTWQNESSTPNESSRSSASSVLSTRTSSASNRSLMSTSPTAAPS